MNPQYRRAIVNAIALVLFTALIVWCAGFLMKFGFIEAMLDRWSRLDSGRQAELIYQAFLVLVVARVIMILIKYVREARRPVKYSGQIETLSPNLGVARYVGHRKPLADDVVSERVEREGIMEFLKQRSNNPDVIARAFLLITQSPGPYFKGVLDRVLLSETEKDNERMSVKLGDRRIAVHEAGHTYLAYRLGVPIISVGYRSSDSNPGSLQVTPPATPQETFNQMVTIMGGTMAENLLMGSRSMGAASDMSQAVNLAATLVSVGWAPSGRELSHSEIIDSARSHAARTIAGSKDILHDLATAIELRRELNAADVADIIQKHDSETKETR